MAQKYRSSSNDRRINVILKPREYMMFEAERIGMIRGESEHVREIITERYKAMNETTQRQLLDDYMKYVKNNKGG